MGQKAILRLFFENPGTGYHLRRIARLTKTPKTTVSRELRALIKESIIQKEHGDPYDTYRATTRSALYTFYKQQAILERIIRSGIIDHIEKTTLPRTIILFGSAARGDYTKESDIDLFVEAEEQEINLSGFKLGHQVNLFFSEDIWSVTNDLRANILTGTTLYGMVDYGRIDGLLRMPRTTSQRGADKPA
jgi:predicted nucleotidyltransferase